jgi:succinate--hydroxymethylglutarate CoA-transferase
MVTEVEHPACGPMKLVNTPVKYSFSKPSIRTPPPTLGQHTNEVLEGLLGMGPDEIKTLRDQGVIA